MSYHLLEDRLHAYNFSAAQTTVRINVYIAIAHNYLSCIIMKYMLMMMNMYVHVHMHVCTYACTYSSLCIEMNMYVHNYTRVIALQQNRILTYT